MRPLRGGAWYFPEYTIHGTNETGPGQRADRIGFRLALSADYPELEEVRGE